MAFGYTGNSGAATGIVYAGQVIGLQAWAPAALVLNVDAYHPGVAQDVSGAAFMVAGAGQWDNYSSATLGCWRQPGAAGWSCGTLAANGAVQISPAVQFYGGSATTVGTAAWLYAQSCALVASSSVAGGSEPAVLTAKGECVRSMGYALDDLGTGVAVYATKQGDIAFARRTLAAGLAAWAPRVKLLSASTAPGSYAAATAPGGESTLAWTIGKPGATTTQVWTATVSAAGALGPSTLLSPTACDIGVAVTALANGDVVLAWGGVVGKSCEAMAATRPAGRAFGPPVRVSTGAKVKAIVATHTAGGSVVLAWNDPNKGATAAVRTGAGFSPPRKLGAAGTVSVAAGGGMVNAAWCQSLCYASTLSLP